MPNIRHLVNINAPAQKVYELITTKAGLQSWWTDKVEGNEKAGDTLSFHFGPNYHKEMKITGLTPGKEVKWLCIAGDPEWIGTTIDFAIEDKGDKCILRFAHDGWKSETDLLGQCSYHWAGYLWSLKNVVEGKEGAQHKN